MISRSDALRGCGSQHPTTPAGTISRAIHGHRAPLQQILDQFLDNLYAMDKNFISDDTLDQLPNPAQLGKTRVGGIDLNKPRTCAVLAAALSLACSRFHFQTVCSHYQGNAKSGSGKL